VDRGRGYSGAMRSLARLLAVVSVCAVPLVGASGAAAAVEAGNNCPADTFAPSNSIVQLARAAGAPLPINAPIDGVITKWRVTLGTGSSGVYAQTLKVLHPTVDPKSFEVLAESARGAVVEGMNEFDTRLSVRAGDRFGLNGLAGVLYCNSAGGATDKLGFLSGNPTPGSIFIVTAEQANRLIPASVTIEADADHDGYGDETQDQCPGNPAAHFLCSPVIAPPSPVALAIGAVTRAQKGSALVLVTSSVQASTTVSGTVKLRKGIPKKLSAGTRTAQPGAITPFTFRFPEALKTKLGELSPKQSLKLKVQIAATDPAGRTLVKPAVVKLPGQG
jgi:hypothetical protein